MLLTYGSNNSAVGLNRNTTDRDIECRRRLRDVTLGLFTTNLGRFPTYSPDGSHLKLKSHTSLKKCKISLSQISGKVCKSIGIGVGAKQRRHYKFNVEWKSRKSSFYTVKVPQNPQLYTTDMLREH